MSAAAKRMRRRKPKSVASKALALARKNKSQLTAELKSYDGSIAAGLSTTWNITYLPEIARGDGFATRDGKSCKLKTFNFRGSIKVGTLGTYANVRVVLVRRPVMDGSLLNNMNQVYLDLGFESLRLLSRTSEYKVLYDKTFTVSHNARPTVNLTINKELNQVLTFSDTDTTGIEANCRKNGYYMCILADTSVTAPTIDAKYRLRFYDN